MQVQPRLDELTLIIPRKKNADANGNRDQLFLPNRWHDLKMVLNSYFGRSVETGARGLYHDGQSLYEDDSRVLIFDKCMLPADDVISIIRDKVLLQKDCDQDSLYVSWFGRATLIYRDDVQQVTLSEAA